MNMCGLTGIMVKTFEIDKNDDNISDLNNFLYAFDGNIIDIQSHLMHYGMIKIVVIYRGI